MTNFVNPYNFIPFENTSVEKRTREDSYKSDLVTGWMDISLYTKTPIIVPDMEHPIGAGKYKFMKYGEDYVIPGSTIRGMVRSAYEAVTNSCVNQVIDKNPISQRVPTYSSISRRGLLGYKDGVWTLYNAEKIVVKKFEPKNKYEAKMFKKEIEDWIDPTGKKMEDGTFLQYNVPVSLNPPSDSNPNGQPYTIYKLRKMNVAYVWEKDDDEPFKKLKSSLERDGALKKQKNPNEKCQEQLKSALEKAKKDPTQLVPVYFFIVQRDNEENEKIVYMSGSSIGRIAQRRKWDDVLGEHAPCTGPKFCPACLLFGSIKCQGLKGRVRFSDAYTEGPVESQMRVLKILSSPRPTAFEFYYKKPKDAKYWNMDFYSTQESENDKQGTVFKYLKDAMPRGRKMYWHGNPQSIDAKVSKMNSTMEALSAERPFKFRIYFDEINRNQLEVLKWALTFGENDVDSSLQHKIGHAKPLGFGSVKLVIDSVSERNLSLNNGVVGYNIEKYENVEIDTKAVDTDSNAVKSILAMADANKTKDKLVAYPERDGTIYGWFVKNRKKPENLKTLPEPTSNKVDGLEGEFSDSMNGKSLIESERRGRIEEFVLTKVSPDKKNGRQQVGYFEKWIVFDVPNSIKAGDKIRVEVIKSNNPDKFMAKYKEKV